MFAIPHPEDGARPTWEGLRDGLVTGVDLDWRTGEARVSVSSATAKTTIVVLGARSVRCSRSTPARVLAARPTATEDAAFLRVELAGGDSIEIVGSGTFLRRA